MLPANEDKPHCYSSRAESEVYTLLIHSCRKILGRLFPRILILNIHLEASFRTLQRSE